MQILRGEYQARKVELDRLLKARWLRLNLWRSALKESLPRAGGLCAGTCKDGTACDNRVKTGSHCYRHTDQQSTPNLFDQQPTVNTIAFAARYRVTLWAYIDCGIEMERLARRGRFLRSVLKAMLLDKTDPVAPHDTPVEYFGESFEDKAARTRWAEGRALDMDVEDYGPEGESAASGDDAPEAWRDWEASESFKESMSHRKANRWQ